jgi:hypothetical protein
MNIVMLLAHSIEESDQLKLLSGLGHDVFSIGGYIDPGHPHDDKRPALPDVPFHPELKAVVDGLATPDNLTAAKEHIPDAILDWADAVIVHHYEHRWIVPDWPRLRASGKRIIWRTVGQSVEHNERMMAPLHRDGLEIIRYSPKERNIPGYAGEDALIRFYKDPAEWYGWTGEEPVVINITQQLYQRDPYTNWGFWEQATHGLNRMPLGPGSEAIGGPGALTYDEMRAWLRKARCYLYTGTQPASYTLGLIEAMMTGIPVVSIGPEHMRIFPYSADLFEGREIAHRGHLTAEDTRNTVANLLRYPDPRPYERQRAIELFGIDTIAAQWNAYLGAPVKVAA